TAGSDKPGEKAEEGKKEKKESIDRQHFLNSTWQIGLVEKKIDADGKVTDSPSTNWWEGWLLDLNLVKVDDSSYRLEGLVANLGFRGITPAAKVSVVLADDQNQNKTVVLPLDLPELPASPREATNTVYEEQRKGTLDFKTLAATKISQNTFKVDLKGKLPDKFAPHKLTQVRRTVAPQAAKGADGVQVKDHQRFANEFWVMDVQMVSAPGLNRGLRGVLYNRSGLQLTPPVFTVTISADG